MTRARATLVSIDETPYYHCTGRCVRRAFLCGHDKIDGRSYEHRRTWMQKRLSLLSEVFAIDLCAYALMSNHYHLVIKLNPGVVESWSDDEIIRRWTKVFSGPNVVQQYLAGKSLSPAESAQLGTCVAQWRERVCSLSWFMRCLNQYIARMANIEDSCTGHFWEGRFSSQALLDETALLTAMAYVDLNPVRAGIAKSIADSDYTSAQDRLQETVPDSAALKPKLISLANAASDDAQNDLPFNVRDYLELLDTTGRCVVPGKRGAIAGTQPRLLQQMGVSVDGWLTTVTQLHRRYELAIGSPGRLQALAIRQGKRWVWGLSQARRFYPAPSISH